MKLTHLPLADTFIIEPQIYNDERGYFFESFNAKKFQQLSGRNVNFVQDNHSLSKKGVIRGLHYQVAPLQQAKLVRVIQGEIWDVIVDIRPRSNTFGAWFGTYLSAQNKKQLWVPEGFAHGFLTISNTAEVSYKVNNFYDPMFERTLLWNDKHVDIKWPSCSRYILSRKDKMGNVFSALMLTDAISLQGG